ncbi:MAG: LolA family protein [Ignavibacteriaceae bacterium]
MKKIFAAIIILILFTQSSFSENKGEQLLKSLQEKFNSISNITADFKQIVNGKVNLAGKFYFEKNNKLRLELKNLIIVSDGITNWSYNKRENKVVISNYDSENPPLFSIDKFIETYPSQCKVSSINEDGKEVLILTAKNSSMNFKTVKIWLNGENLIEKLLIDSGGKTVEMTFTGYKTNQKNNGSKFTFTPPKGSAIVDLR